MQVFKFGGASVKDSKGIKNVALILQKFADHNLVVVVSAMGKTTNALERVLALYQNYGDYLHELSLLKEYHRTLMTDLFPSTHNVWKVIDNEWRTLERNLKASYDEPDQRYDQVVSHGEILSSLIVAHYLQHLGTNAEWFDARNYVVTDENYREAIVDWNATTAKIKTLDFNTSKIKITQGFLGKNSSGFTTTLGRDGSDFSAAIFAYCLDAKGVTIWKDVPGVMNADPKRMNAVTVFEELPFREAAEMTYYGASVIHPKTIKPLATKGIPLYVKNFDDPSLAGTKIHECHVEKLPPLFVFKDNQCLISCKVTDYTFVTEDHMRKIFHALSELNIHLNMMQNSAISFSFCIDFRESKVKALIQTLQHFFEVYYNTGLTLVTIKNYDQESFESFRKKPGVILEQSSRSTLQLLMKDLSPSPSPKGAG